MSHTSLSRGRGTVPRAVVDKRAAGRELDRLSGEQLACRSVGVLWQRYAARPVICLRS